MHGVSLTQADHRRAACRGFNLIELMITCALVGGLVTVSIAGLLSQQQRRTRVEAQAALGDWVLALTLSELQGGHIEQVGKLPVTDLSDRMLATYDFILVPERPAFGQQFWVTAQPRPSSHQTGMGALSLSRAGLGCWHRSRDRIEIPACGSTDELW